MVEIASTVGSEAERDAPAVPSHVGVRWLGHASVVVEVDGARVLTDPLLRGRFLHVLRRAAPVDVSEVRGHIDVIVVSHLHWDHADMASLRAVGVDVPVVVPRGAGVLMRRAGMRQVEELGAGESIDVAGTRIEATGAHHSGFRPPFGPRATANGYLIGRSQRVYFAGDTGMFPGLGDLGGGVDVALLPVGGWGPTLRGGHFDAAGAAEAAALVGPRVVLPIHWGTYWPIGVPLGRRFSEPGPRFVEAVGRLAPEMDAHLWSVGERVPVE
ncbi:MAG: MBL fold metallo-hydrolase [Dehalococcoidia bacterium]|nr:MAG: MBL fold metallo-hydrolase [Dehalococcoidia bacterium]